LLLDRTAVLWFGPVLPSAVESEQRAGASAREARRRPDDPDSPPRSPRPLADPPPPRRSEDGVRRGRSRTLGTVEPSVARRGESLFVGRDLRARRRSLRFVRAAARQRLAGRAGGEPESG